MWKICNRLILLTLAPVLFNSPALAQNAFEPPTGDPSTLEHSSPKVVRVHCGGNKTIARALNRAKPERALIIEFTGTCQERIVIARGDVTLRGVGDTPTIVGQVAVQGGTRVRLENFLVRDTQGAPDPFFPDGDGISVLASTDVTLRGITVQDTERRGISIEGSTATVIDSTVLRAQGISFIALSAFVNIEGTLTANDGGATSVCAAMSGHIFVRPDATVIANNNPIGILSEVNGVITLAVRARVEANGNQFIGFGSVTGGTVVFSDADIQINDNQGLGLIVSEVSSWGPFADSNALLDISNNAFAGAIIERSSMGNFEYGTTVTGNGGPGILIEDSRAAIKGSVSTGNASHDLMFVFNGRGSLGPDNQLDTPIFCDDTSMIEGEGTCAAPETTQAQARAIRARVDSLRAKIRQYTPYSSAGGR